MLIVIDYSVCIWKKKIESLIGQALVSIRLHPNKIKLLFVSYTFSHSQYILVDFKRIVKNKPVTMVTRDTSYICFT